MGSAAPRQSNLKRLANSLNTASEASRTELSSYGYIMWVLDHHGIRGIQRGALQYTTSVDGYVTDAIKHKEDITIHLVNASQYVDKVVNTIQDSSVAKVKLAEMSFPHVIYLLFASAGQQAFVEEYRGALKEHLKRYPGTLEKLPESFRQAGEEVLNDNI